MCLFKIFGPISARTVLYLISLSGFIVSYMLRTDMNVAILAMVRQNPNKNDNSDTAEYSVCFGKLEKENITMKATLTSILDEDMENKTASVLTNEVNPPPSTYSDGAYVEWSINEQSYVLASFYWMYVISQVLGAVLTQHWGMKRVYGYAHLLTALCSYLLPVSSVTHLGLAILIRSVQGFILGVTWPAIFAGQQYWIPKSERSCYLTSFQGYNLGIGITYPICGFIITYWGWEAVFYTTGTIGILWCIIWYFFVYDSPDLHPRISNEERQYIQTNTETLSYEDSRKQRIPWWKIVSSGPIVIIGVACFGWIWVNYVFMIAGPTYLKSILGFNIGHSGILSGLPFLISFPMGFVLHCIADKLIESKLMTTINVRKLCTALASVLPGAMCLIISQLDCNSTVILACMLIAVSFPAAIFSGCIPNIVAVAPEFAGPAIAVIQTIYMSASFISPLVIGYLAQDGHNLQVWKNVFYIAAAVAFLSYIPYLIWATNEVQPWNYSLDSETEFDQKEKMLNQQDKNKNIQILKHGSGDIVRNKTDMLC